MGRAGRRAADTTVLYLLTQKHRLYKTTQLSQI